MKILVTGCAGYIGSQLCKKLLNNYNVVGVDNLFYDNHNVAASLMTYPNFRFEKRDVNTDISDLINECDIIIWLAALVGAPICDKLRSLAQDTNFESVRRNLTKLSKNQKILFANTNSGYGIGGEGLCTETSEMNPLSLYATSKLAAEKVILQHENSVSFRLATVFGGSSRVRSDLMVNNWTCKIFFDKKIEVYEPHFRRNFVNINDVCRAFCWALDPNFNGIYNVGLPTANLTKMELAQLICDELNVARENITIGNGKDPDQRDYLVSNDKLLKTSFNFQYTLEDGIKDMVQLCKLYGPNIFKLGNFIG